MRREMEVMRMCLGVRSGKAALRLPANKIFWGNVKDLQHHSTAVFRGLKSSRRINVFVFLK